MFLHINKKSRVTNRKKTNKRNAKHAAKQRRRVNRMAGRPLSRSSKRR